MTYTTAATVKTYLGISTSTDDTIIGDCITRAQAAIDTACNRTFEASADTTRYFDVPADDDTELIFDADCCAITSVTNGDSDALTVNTEYVTMPRNLTPYYGVELTSGGGIAWTYTTTPERAIAVVGRWAYSTSAPADIVQACIRLAVWFYHQRTNPSEGSQTIVTETGAVIVGAGLPKDVTEVLARYRRASL